MKRFRGGGVGHASTRAATDFFKQDRDSRDAKRVRDEGDDNYDQTQYHDDEPRVPTNQSRADRDEEEEDYGYNRREISDMDDEEEEEERSDDEFGGEVDADNFGYGEM